MPERARRSQCPKPLPQIANPAKGPCNGLRWPLTLGLGPTKARRVIEFFGSVQALFRASLTELEAAGLRAVSAQSLGTGRSMKMAQDELGKAAAADARIVALDDPGYPTQLEQIYDPPLILYVRGNETAISQPGLRWLVRDIPRHTDQVWRSGWPAISRRVDW
jgi:hypothetical protein